MRVPIDPAVEEAPPPPYTAYEASPAVPTGHASPEPAAMGSLPIRTSLRGGYIRRIPNQESEGSPVRSPAAYFEERRFRRDSASEELDLLEHNIHFESDTATARLPFPRPSDAYLRRDVTGQDWATFVNCLFAVQQENRKMKVKSDEKAVKPGRPDASGQSEKIQAVIAEWNVGFFAPRLIRIIAHFEPLSNGETSSSAPPQVSRYRSAQSRGLSHCQENVYSGPPAYGPPSSSSTGLLQPGPANLEPPRTLRRSSSKSSISSSSSSTSSSSIDSIASKDFDHATLPEIQAIIASFRADPHKKNHIRKSVKELRRQLRSQHLPFSSSDPYSTKFSKDEKRKFKEQRKTLKKEIKTIIKEAKDERKAERSFRRAARKNRRDARKHERHELKQARHYEKHCRREGRGANRETERGQRRTIHQTLPDPHLQGPPPSVSPIPGIPQARAAYARTSSWSSERVAAVRTRSHDAAASAREKADLAHQHAAGVAAAVSESARQAGLQAKDMACHAGRRASNTAANASAKTQDTVYGTSRRV